MNTKIQELHKKAELTYLEDQELERINHYLLYSLSKRVEIYKLISSQEIDIFQPIANQINTIFTEEEPEKIELALKYWISILRHWCMALIIEEPNYLNDHILEWLVPQIKGYQISILSNKIFSLLQKSLSKKLSSVQYSLIKPYIQETEKNLVNPNFSS